MPLNVTVTTTKIMITIHNNNITSSSDHNDKIIKLYRGRLFSGQPALAASSSDRLKCRNLSRSSGSVEHREEASADCVRAYLSARIWHHISPNFGTRLERDDAGNHYDAVTIELTEVVVVERRKCVSVWAPLKARDAPFSIGAFCSRWRFRSTLVNLVNHLPSCVFNSRRCEGH